jgi:hypothetical protein
MIVRENRALSEWIRDRCKRTGIDNRLPISWPIKFPPGLQLQQPLAVFLLRALIHEFARVLRAIIHGAVNSQKLPNLSTN